MSGPGAVPGAFSYTQNPFEKGPNSQPLGPQFQSQNVTSHSSLAVVKSFSKKLGWLGKKSNIDIMDILTNKPPVTLRAPEAVPGLKDLKLHNHTST